jgi:hypothetical protein
LYRKNHTNCELRIHELQQGTTIVPKVGIWATKTIPKGHELRINYGVTDKEELKRMPWLKQDPKGLCLAPNAEQIQRMRYFEEVSRFFLNVE